MNQTLSVRFIFAMVLLSVLSALIIGSIFGTMDPSILSGADPGLATYLAMFIGQGFLIVHREFTTIANDVPVEVVGRNANLKPLASGRGWIFTPFPPTSRPHR